jgi:pilus assembly protein FimV
MNRLKAGKILTLPEKSAIEAVSIGEARKVVVAQSADWNAYRNKLAGIAAQAPVKESAARQESAGKISARVEDKATPAVEAKDQLKVSKTVADGGKAGVLAKEDLIAKEKALKEAKERLASLEKNVVDLQKLVELKNQNLAELQKQASTKAVPVEARNRPKPSRRCLRRLQPQSRNRRKKRLMRNRLSPSQSPNPSLNRKKPRSRLRPPNPLQQQSPSLCCRLRPRPRNLVSLKSCSIIRWLLPVVVEFWRSSPPTSSADVVAAARSRKCRWI